MRLRIVTPMYGGMCTGNYHDGILVTAMELQRQGVACELYPENVKFDKQFKYAERRNIPRKSG